MPVPGSAQQPSPERFFEVMNAYQQTAALKAAIELDLFTAIGEGAETAPALAQRCRASERGTRIRSEERRVGKECRCRRAREDERKSGQGTGGQQRSSEAG